MHRHIWKLTGKVLQHRPSLAEGSGVRSLGDSCRNTAPGQPMGARGGQAQTPGRKAEQQKGVAPKAPFPLCALHKQAQGNVLWGAFREGGIHCLSRVLSSCKIQLTFHVKQSHSLFFTAGCGTCFFLQSTLFLTQSVSFLRTNQH